jgi:hypothetical protein
LYVAVSHRETVFAVVRVSDIARYRLRPVLRNCSPSRDHYEAVQALQ